MIWTTVSSWSCFCWLYRASPSLAPKNIFNLISGLTIWWCPCVESLLLCCWKRVFAMTSAFSWQNSINLSPASFCIPRPILPVSSSHPSIAQRVEWRTVDLTRVVILRLLVWFRPKGGAGCFWTSLVAQMVKRLPAMRETRVQSLGQEDLLEKEMATHSSILAWKIP